jgi:hypothetical protein
MWNVMWFNQGYAPEQPIPFSHKLHAGDNHIPCLYCHTNVERSPHATVPALNVCMNCHSVVAVNKPNIQKLTTAYNSGKPIEWVRIHKIPDHARFDHQWHIAKGFDCAVCHGPIATMDRVYQYRRLDMGDCVTCHRENNGPVSCNTCHQ